MENLLTISIAFLTFNVIGRSVGLIEISAFYAIWFLVIVSRSANDFCMKVVISVARYKIRASGLLSMNWSNSSKIF